MSTVVGFVPRGCTLCRSGCLTCVRPSSHARRTVRLPQSQQVVMPRTTRRSSTPSALTTVEARRDLDRRRGQRVRVVAASHPRWSQVSQQRSLRGRQHQDRVPRAHGLRLLQPAQLRGARPARVLWAPGSGHVSDFAATSVSSSTVDRSKRLPLHPFSRRTVYCSFVRVAYCGFARIINKASFALNERLSPAAVTSICPVSSSFS